MNAPSRNTGSEEQIDGGHGHDHAVLPAGRFELAHDAVALGGRGVDGNQIVVVQVHAPRADFAKQASKFGGRQNRADRRLQMDRGRGLPTVHNPKENLCSGFGR